MLQNFILAITFYSLAILLMSTLTTEETHAYENKLIDSLYYPTYRAILCLILIIISYINVCLYVYKFFSLF